MLLKYQLTVKFLSSVGFSERNTQKFCLWRFMTQNPQRHASTPLPHYRLIHLRQVAGNPDNTASR